MNERLSAFRLRAQVYALIRNFFSKRNVLEVETPILSAFGNTAPNIESFCTEFSGHVDAGERQRWLRTSPEFPLKRLLAEGIGDCYELGRVFRNGETGVRHNPEFTLLEWYRVGWTEQQLLAELSDLVSVIFSKIGRVVAIKKMTYRDWFYEYLQLDPHNAPIESLQAVLHPIRIAAETLQRDDWLDLIVTHRLQAQNPKDSLLLIYDYPASQCALARVRAGSPPVAERFEAYLGEFELANGYHELNNAEEQRTRFLCDQALRAERGLVQPKIDEHLLAALPQLPDCAGVAMGVDRLLMAMSGVVDIRKILSFDFSQA